MYMCLLIAHGKIEPSNSFPTDSQPMTMSITRRQQSNDDIRRRLDYETSQKSIAEETPEQPSQVCC